MSPAAALDSGAVRCLTDQVAALLASGLAPRPLEGGIRLGKRCGSVAPIMALTKRMATVGHDRGPCRSHARVLALRTASLGPPEVAAGRARLRTGAAPAGRASHGAMARHGRVRGCTPWGARPWRRQASRATRQPPCCVAISQAIAVLPRVAGQEWPRALVRQRPHVGRRDAALGGQCGVQLAVWGAGLLPPPAQAHDVIVRHRGSRRARGLAPPLTARAGASLHPGRAGSAPVDSQPRERARASARSYPRQIVARHEQIATMGTGHAQVDQSCVRGRIMASGFSWAPPWRASSPRWLRVRADASPMITLFPSQGDFCVTASSLAGVAICL